MENDGWIYVEHVNECPSKDVTTNLGFWYFGCKFRVDEIIVCL